MAGKGTLMERVVGRAEAVMGARGYSPKTRRSYIGWIKRFMRFHAGVHPMRYRREHVEDFLAHLGGTLRLSARSRNLAASALSFLYAGILGKEGLEDVRRARGGRHVPVVLSRREVRAVLGELRGRDLLIAGLLYGTGMRVGECVALRLKDLDFELRQITVRDGKGAQDRYAILPERLVDGLRRQERRVVLQHRADRGDGGGWAPLPGALHLKVPGAGWEIGWQYLFPARKQSTDPATGRRGRAHLHPSAIQRAVKAAVRASGIVKRASCHTLRHSFASQLLRDGYDIRQVKDLLGHKDVRTTMIYLHAVDQTGLAVTSPLDRPGFDGPVGHGGRG